MPRPISVTIHKDALRHNLNRMKKFAGARTLWAVVKANAYGHGLSNAVEAFSEADGLALLDVCDAVKVRELGWKKRVLLLEGFFDAQDIEILEKYDIETNIHSDWMIEALKNHSKLTEIKVHIKINSGMNRLGFLLKDVEKKRAELQAIPGVSILGVVTHFANAEPSYKKELPASVALQLSRMGDYATATHGVCMANSAALLFHPEVAGDAVRAGIALYGASPDQNVSNETLDIIPAMTFSAKIIAIQKIGVGEAVAYGSRWIAQRPTRVAVVACGYADGYPRSMPDGAPVYVEGHIARLIGSVCMDMLQIDVTDFPDVKVGSTVELWGRHILVNDLAKLCGTIGYELLCAIAPRVPVCSD